MYNYFISSWGTTLTVIWVWTSECRLISTLNSPRDFISFEGWILDGFISSFSFSWINLEISVGLTDPYNSLFSVLNLSILYSLFFSLFSISFASFFLSWSLLFRSFLIFSTSLIFSLEANRAFFFEINNFGHNLFWHQLFHLLIQLFLNFLIKLLSYYIRARFLALFIDRDRPLCLFWLTEVILEGKILPFSDTYLFNNFIFL